MKTLNHIPSLKTAILLIASITTTLFAENKETITHSFLGVGKANQVVIVGEDGKVQWALRRAGQRWLGAPKWKCVARALWHQGLPAWRRGGN